MIHPGFIKNPDDEYVRNFKKRLKSNNGYCPCRIEKKPDNKCPCKAWRENAECICGLYIRDPEYISGE